MRKKHLVIAAVSFCSIFTYGCVASERDTDFLYSRQREIETTLKKTQKDIDWIKAEVKKEDNLLDLNEKTFELENKLLELEQVIGEMHTRIEERFKNMESKLSMSAVVGAESTVVGAESTVVGAESAVAGAESAVAEPQTPPATAPVEAPETPTGKPETEPPPAEKNPKENYDLGLKELDDGNYEAARALLRKHLADSPQGDEAPDAMFLIADSYFREKLYEEAILEYQNLIETWPASPKIPLCQLNQGLALMEIGKPNEASLFFESLIESYPKSPEAAEAKKHLKSLSGADE